MTGSDTRRPRRKCVATIRSGPRKGEQCTAWALHGSTCCNAHLRNPDARANAKVRAELEMWTVGDVVDDPGEVLLKLVTQSRRRADRLATELHAIVDRHGGSLHDALVGNSYVTTADGDTVKVGEYVRGLAKLENEERDRCARFAERAVAAGLAERQVRLAERQGELLNTVLLGVLEELGMTEEQLDRVPDLIDRHLDLVAG